ncbi:MAG: NAD(P)H-dependent oxidoreductase [Lachnospiraceae bacterium]|nr:NAD(P)H-dependent oxidoreductase [Lachnospiraceae bacterium]MBR4605342.1 NAD(P)H-dependent oxidoreductase [Lachnospiraceae bacterium]
MRVLILNGSPSGENSITLQTMHYIQKFYPKQEYHELHVGQKIRMFETDFSKAAEELKAAELVVFCYPVYTFLAPAQLHRFIELMKESGIDFRGKYATQVTTSKHFYDVTAHEYVRENAEDMGFTVIRGLSADMEDLLHPKGQKEARAFFRHVLWSIKYDRGELSKVTAEIDQGKKIAIVADVAEGNEVLPKMIEEFQAASEAEVTVVNIREFPFAGGCLGCFHCAADGTCIYKDRFDEFLREKIQVADACVYAFTIKDHSMGQRFKLFDDRQFCNGHRTVTMGKPVGYLIDGDYGKEPNLRTLIEARAQVGGNYFAGAVAWTDTVQAHGMTEQYEVKAGEDGTADVAMAGKAGTKGQSEGNVKVEIRRLAAELSYCMRHRYNQPADFYGVGGMKIFRDLIYQMQGMMREDHRFYKEHGFYDFPQKRMGTILGMYLVGAMMNNPKLSKKIGGNMTKGMLMPYQSVIDKAKPRK